MSLRSEGRETPQCSVVTWLTLSIAFEACGPELAFPSNC